MQYSIIKKLIIIIFTCIFLFGCSGTVGKDEAFTKKLKNMTSYSCNVTAKVKNNKGIMKYELKHFYKKSIGYRVEVLEPDEIKGQIMIYKSNEFLSYNPATDHMLVIDDSNENFGYHMLLGTFLQYYNEANTLELKEENYKDNQCKVYELPLQSGNHYMNKAKLYVNKKDGIPLKMDIFDEGGNKTTEIDYSDFVMNANIDKGLFQLEKNQ